MNKKRNINEERLNKNFENINTWINNCDNKASVMLGFIWIIAKIVLTNNDFITLFIKLIISACKNINFSDFLYLIFLFGTLLMIIYGIYKIFKVICPTLKNTSSEGKSLIYYDSISQMDFLLYNEQISKSSNEDYIEDLLSQIYINSKICSKKFKNFKFGFSYTMLGLILFSILFVIGLLIYL